MGLPARRYEQGTRPSRPRLRVVPASHRPARAVQSSAARRARDARCREAFTAFLVFAVAFSTVGVARVALAARAAAVSIESGNLRKEIKSARFEGDMLEIQLSALATPSRIQAIAGTTMKMSKAPNVCYIAIDGSTKCSPAPTKDVDVAEQVPAPRPRTAATHSSRGLVASIMQTAAGEAQALLIGDVGLASSR